MVPEDLLFWISPLADAPMDDPNVLCRRHADAMVVPMGWTLDDRREDTLRLFKPRASGAAPSETAERSAPRRSRSARPDHAARPEQLQIDGTGEIARPDPAEHAVPSVESNDDPIEPPIGTDPAVETAPAPWQPDFDASDDLDGLLEVSSPLLARAFRGTDRRKP